MATTFEIAAPVDYLILSAPGNSVFHGEPTVNYCAPVATPAASPWQSGVLDFPATHRFAVRKNNGAYESLDTHELEIVLDASGKEIFPPSPPDSVVATNLPKTGILGNVSIVALYDPQPDGAHPASQAVLYGDAGTGTMNFGAVLQAISLLFEGGNKRARVEFTVSGLTNGVKYLFVVRSRTAAGIESLNVGPVGIVASGDTPGGAEQIAVGADA